MIFPARPSRASISRIIVPFPIPPKLGLHEQVPMLSIFGVTNAVFAPVLAAAAQASAPAWPPPMTMTSKGLVENLVQLMRVKNLLGLAETNLEFAAVPNWRRGSPRSDWWHVVRTVICMKLSRYISDQKLLSIFGNVMHCHSDCGFSDGEGIFPDAGAKVHGNLLSDKFWDWLNAFYCGSLLLEV